MWVPAGLVHLAVALTLLVGWLRATQGTDDPPAGDLPALPLAAGTSSAR
jgi:hypothetical protein